MQKLFKSLNTNIDSTTYSITSTGGQCFVFIAKYPISVKFYICSLNKHTDEMSGGVYGGGKFMSY